MTDLELRAMISELRALAWLQSPEHEYWDLVNHAEDVLAGRPCVWGRAEIERRVEKACVKSDPLDVHSIVFNDRGEKCPPDLDRLKNLEEFLDAEEIEVFHSILKQRKVRCQDEEKESE